MSSPAKSPAKKRVAKPKVAAAHPTYAAMIKAAIVALKERGGSSKAAILKYIVQHYKVGDNIKTINAHIRTALVRGAASGALKQVKGTGASGSFRLGEKGEKKAKKASPKKASPKKKTATVAAAAGASPAKKAKKSPKKKTAAKKTKSPKKAKSPKKPKAAKSPRKSKTPKKAKSPAKKRASPKKKASPKKAAPAAVSA